MRNTFVSKRKKMKLSLRQAAKKIGISHATLSNIENGVYKPSFDTLTKLLKFYKTDMDTLMTEQEGGEKVE